MKHALLALCAGSLLLAAPSFAKDNAQANLAATRAYYNELVTAPQPRLAELGLMMNMLPKGGDIHHHYSGAIYAETYVDWLGVKGYCVWRNDNPDKGQRAFYINTEQGGAGEDCLKADAIKADNLFYRQLMMRWSDRNFGDHSHSQNPPDEQFFDTFLYFAPLSSAYVKEGLRILKEQAKAENLQYIETMLKGAPAIDNAALAGAIDALAPDASATEVERAISPFADFLASDKGAGKKIADYVSMVETAATGIDDADFTMRYQSYVSRLQSPSQVFSMMYAALAADEKSPLIVGVNIVGAENSIVSMRDYRLHMMMFRFLKNRFPSARLAMHAGELAVGMVPPEGLRSHIREAVEVAGAERIGHGVDVTHERDAPQLLRLLRERNIPVEINLTSNQFILGVQGAEHPVSLYLSNGVPIVISSDDPGVSRNTISGEYVLFASRYQPSYDVVKNAAYDSIRYSFLTPDERKAQLRMLDQRYARFEQQMAALARAKAWKAK